MTAPRPRYFENLRNGATLAALTGQTAWVAFPCHADMIAAASALAADNRRPLWLAFPRYGSPIMCYSLCGAPISPAALFRITPDGSVHRAL